MVAFRFAGQYFGNLGWFIDTISGVSDDINNGIFWAFIGEENGAPCDFQVGMCSSKTMNQN